MALFNFKKKSGKKLEEKLLQDFKDGKVLKIEKDYSTFNQNPPKQNPPKQNPPKQNPPKQNPPKAQDGK